jgi:hypothetical protein
MGLETATYIDGLVITNPTSTDPKSAGDVRKAGFNR